MEEKSEEQGEAVEEPIETVRREVEEYRDKYTRLLAERENMLKRTQREKRDMTRFAVEGVIAEFLAPLDNFKNALNFIHQTSEETQNWAKGFEMILTQFKEILSDHNIHPFQSEGMVFDPHMHEVIEIEETEKHPEGTIIQEFVQGYKCGDRILRAARVKIAKNPAKTKKSGGNREPINEEQGEN